MVPPMLRPSLSVHLPEDTITVTQAVNDILLDNSKSRYASRKDYHHTSDPAVELL